MSSESGGEARDAARAPAPGRGNRGTIALLLAAVLVLGAVVATREPSQANAPGPGSAAAEQTRRELLDQATVTRGDGRRDTVGAMLDRRAKAVLAGNRAAFLASVDPRDAAFRAEQGRWFDNLAAVPFSGWTYQLGDRGDRTLPAARGALLGPAAFVAPVDVSFQISGYDYSAQHYEQMLTFVPRAGRWYVAGDDDVRSRVSHRELWDVGKVSVVRAKRGLVMGLGPVSLLRGYGRDVDRAVPRVDKVWGNEWSRRVLLVVTRTEDEMASLLGGRPAMYRQLAAVTRGELGAAEGTAAADRVLVNPKAYAELSAVGRRVIMGHEITHVAVRSRTQEWTPKWLSEGFADYVGYLDSGLPVGVIAQELAQDVRAGRVPAQLPRNDAFGTTNSRLPQTYEMSWLACKMIVEHYGGREALVEFFRAVGSPGGDASVVDRAFRDVLGTSRAEFTRQWRGYVETQLS